MCAAPRNDSLRRLRAATLERARQFIALPYDETVAERLADLLARARERRRRAGAMDAIIAATALAHNLAIWTQDDDFDVLAELAPDLVVQRSWRAAGRLPKRLPKLASSERRGENLAHARH